MKLELTAHGRKKLSQRRNKTSMKPTTRTRSILTTLSLALLLAGTAKAGQEELATSMKETRLEAERTRDQLKATLASVTALTKQEKGDLRPAYETFAAEIPKTEAAAAATRKRVAFMQGDGLKYFDDWQKTIDSINNESLRKKSTKRFEAVKKSYIKVTAQLQEAAEKFNPFLSDLSDIQKALANDVTARGVKSLRSTVNDTNWRFKAVNRTVNDALEEMSKMEKSLSSEAN
jgi:hypothetical protein